MWHKICVTVRGSTFRKVMIWYKFMTKQGISRVVALWTGFLKNQRTKESAFNITPPIASLLNLSSAHNMTFSSSISTYFFPYLRKHRHYNRIFMKFTVFCKCNNFYTCKQLLHLQILEKRPNFSRFFFFASVRIVRLEYKERIGEIQRNYS